MSLVWANGAIMKDETIAVSAKNRGLTLGDGVFETILALNRRALWLDEHLARMKDSAAVLGITFPQDDISAAITALLAAGGEGAHVLRLTLTRGATARGLAGESGPPVLVATLDPFDTRLIGEPVTLTTSSIRRNGASIASTHKTLSYVDAIAAAREAASAGAGDALMLNTEGRVASSTIANVFAVVGKKLLTPPRSEGVLPGIMRRILLAEVAGLGLSPSESPLALEQLRSVDCVFLTNSLRLVRPVTRIDGTELDTTGAARFLDHLAASAARICGRDPRK